MADDGSPVPARFRPECLDGELLDLERGHQAVVVVEPQVLADLGGGEQLHDAQAVLAQSGQSLLELGPEPLVIGCQWFPNDDQFAEIDVAIGRYRSQMAAQDRRFLECPSGSTVMAATVVTATRSPGQAAIPSGIDLMEQIGFGRVGCLIFVDFVEEVVEILGILIYIQVLSFQGEAFSWQGVLRPFSFPTLYIHLLSILKRLFTYLLFRWQRGSANNRGIKHPGSKHYNRPTTSDPIPNPRNNLRRSRPLITNEPPV
jgi:hypothetical protein